MKSGGCTGLLIFRDIPRESVLGGWNVTSHLSAKSPIFVRSEESSSAEVSGSVTII